MTGFVLVRKTVRDVRDATLWVAVANFLLALFVVALYPSFKDMLAEFELPDFYRGMLGEAGTLASPEGYLGVYFYSWIPILLITLAIIGATGTLAGEEGAGTLDLLLAQPVTRTRLVLAKTAGLVLAVTAAALAGFLGFALGAVFVDIQIGIGRMAAAVIGSMLPITLLGLTLSLWGSAALPSRGAAAALATGVVVIAYFLNTIGATVDMLETPRRLSPFYWSDASHILLYGFDWARAGGLLAVAAALLGLALRGFQRRDITAGAREWVFGPAQAAGLLRRRIVRRWEHERERPSVAPAMPVAPARGRTATRFVLLRKTMRDVRTAAIWVGVADLVFALLVALVYPSYREQLAGMEMPAAFRGFLGEAGEYSSPAGYLNTEFFSWIPLLLITIAIIGATGALAGEEGAGTLDLLLAQPVTRTRLVLAKAAGLTIAITLAVLASLPGFLLAGVFVEVDVSVARLVLATVYLLPITLLFLTFSLWASGALPSRGAAVGAATGAVVVTYFLHVLGAAVDVLETPRKLSPFYWSDASRILLHGFHEWARVGGMLGIAALFLLLALWSFQRRDIAAGAREWRLFAWRPRLPFHRHGEPLPPHRVKPA